MIWLWGMGAIAAAILGLLGKLAWSASLAKDFRVISQFQKKKDGWVYIYFNMQVQRGKWGDVQSCTAFYKFFAPMASDAPGRPTVARWLEKGTNIEKGALKAIQAYRKNEEARNIASEAFNLMTDDLEEPFEKLKVRVDDRNKLFDKTIDEIDEAVRLKAQK